MAMLHHVKYKLFFLLSICLAVYACKKEQENILSAQSKKLSEVSIGSKQYNAIYQNATDSIHSWVSNKVSVWKDEKLGKSIVLDSLLCFNSKKDKLITALLAKTLDTNYSVDGVHFFYGVKIKEHWYFFMGPHVVLPRENYQKDIHTPLPFPKLHEIAIDEVFRGYLKKKDLGFWRNVFGKTEYEVNEGFFNQLDYSKWGFFNNEGKLVDNSKLTQAQLDSHLLAKAVFSNWKARDTTSSQSSQ